MLIEPKHFKSKGLIYNRQSWQTFLEWYQSCQRADHWIVERLKSAIFIQGFFVRQRLCEHHMPVTQHQWITLTWGNKGREWRLSQGTMEIIYGNELCHFSRQSWIMFILKRDYSKSDSCSKQILSKSFMFNIWIESPKEYVIYHIHGGKKWICSLTTRDTLGLCEWILCFVRQSYVIISAIHPVKSLS